MWAFLNYLESVENFIIKIGFDLSVGTDGGDAGEQAFFVRIQSERRKVAHDVQRVADERFGQAAAAGELEKRFGNFGKIFEAENRRRVARGEAHQRDLDCSANQHAPFCLTR